MQDRYMGEGYSVLSQILEERIEVLEWTLRALPPHNLWARVAVRARITEARQILDAFRQVMH